MILVTRLNGPVFALNPDLLERADCTPDTVVTLVDGTKYVISESVPELIALIRDYRASVIAAAQRVEAAPQSGTDHADAPEGSGNVVPLHRRDR